MEERQNQLDDFLRRRLSDSSEDPSWNVPDDAVFERALGAIPAGKRRRRGLWLIIPAGLIAGLMLFAWLHYRQIQTLQHKIDQLEASIDHPISDSRSEAVLSDHQHLTPVPPDPVAPDQSTTGAQTDKLYTEAVPGSQSAETNSLESRFGFIDKKEVRTSGLGRIDEPTVQADKKLTEQEVIPSSIQAHAEPGELRSSAEDVPLLRGLPLQAVVHEVEGIVISVTPAIAQPVQLSSASRDGILQITNQSPRFGVMITGNQSWYSMSNVPSNMQTRLYNYENHQPGIGVEGFIEFPFSKRFSAQVTMGCHFFQNKSFLKDQFAFEMAQVSVGQDGHFYYNMDIDLMNPLGDYSPMINFRVSEQMAENEMIEERIGIRQTLKTMQMNLGLNALLIDTRRFDISVGAGAGLACTAWLDNEFDVSLYHEGQLYYNQIELTDHLDNVNKLQLLGYGQFGLTYYVNDRLGLLMQGGYQRGLTSLRNARKSNGTQTYLHALNVSLGITRNF